MGGWLVEDAAACLLRPYRAQQSVPHARCQAGLQSAELPQLGAWEIFAFIWHSEFSAADTDWWSTPGLQGIAPLLLIRVGGHAKVLCGSSTPSGRLGQMAAQSALRLI